MTSKIFNSVAKVGLPILLLTFALPVFGTNVTYTSTGEFCLGPNPCKTINPLVENPADSSVSVGTFPNFTYFGAIGFTSTVNTPSQAVAGEFDVSVIGGKPRNLPAGEIYTLYITQTNPAAGTASLVGGFAGNVAIGSNNVTITFAKTSIVLGLYTYTLDQKVYTLPTLSSPSHIDKIMMEVAPTAPEPTFMGLTGLGFAGLAFVAYRRKRTV